MRKCKIIFKDEMNAKVMGLDPKTASACEKRLSFLLPHRFHVAAYKLGRWDGTVKFFKKESGNTYISALEYVIDIIVNEGRYEIEFEDHRLPFVGEPLEATTDMFSNYTWPEGHPIEGQPITLREDQAESANVFLQRRYGLMCLPTSYGKTILSAAIAKSLEHMGRTIVIVPSTSLVTQTYDDFKNVGLDAGAIHAKSKEYDCHHTITTWQSLLSIFKSGDIDVVNRLTRDLILVNVDECHQIKDTSKLKDFLSNYFHHVPYRLGLTGTVPKEDYLSMSITSSLGNLIHRVPLSKMQELGFIAKCEVHNIITPEEYNFKNYHDEAAHLTKNSQRLQFIADSTEIIRETGNTLILINGIEAGKELHSLIPNSKFVYGKTAEKERTKTYKGVNNEENTVVIATFQVAAVGINIPRIFNLITIEPGKSFIRVVQSIGRAIRIAKDKDFARIFDISATSKFSKRHLMERKKYYQEMEYPYEVYDSDSYDKCIEQIAKITEGESIKKKRDEDDR